MPFASDAQRRYLYARKPRVARKFAHDEVAKRRKGTFVQRQMAPVIEDADVRLGRRMAEADQMGQRLVGQISREGDKVTRTLHATGRMATRRAAIGLAAGIGGGLTLGEIGRQSTQRAFNRRKRTKSQYALAKAAGDYVYLLPTIREEVQFGIPESRLNPVSPLQMLAASNISGEGLAKIRSRNPFGRTRRTKEGVYLMGLGGSMAVQPLGVGVMRP